MLFKKKIETLFKKKIETPEVPKIEEKKPTTLAEQLEDINLRLGMLSGAKSSAKTKKLKFKYSVRTQMKKVAKKNKLLVFILGTNRNCDAQIVDVRNGYFVVDGVPRRCTMDYVYLWRGKIPCVILPEWSLEPVGIKDYYDRNPEGLPSADAQKMVIGVIESGEVLSKKSFQPKTIIFAVIGILILGYILLGGFPT